MVKVVWLAGGQDGSHADCLQSTKRQPVPKGLVMCRNVCAAGSRAGRGRGGGDGEGGGGVAG
jgi:hypothetical protein